MKMRFICSVFGALCLGVGVIGFSGGVEAKNGVEVSGKKEVKHLPTCGCARCGGVKGGGI